MLVLVLVLLAAVGPVDGLCLWEMGRHERGLVVLLSRSGDERITRGWDVGRGCHGGGDEDWEGSRGDVVDGDGVKHLDAVQGARVLGLEGHYATVVGLESDIWTKRGGGRRLTCGGLGL